MDRRVELTTTGKTEETVAPDYRSLDVYCQENSSCIQHYSSSVCCVHNKLYIDSHNKGRGYADNEKKFCAHKETSKGKSSGTAR